ncbi:peptidoglycan-binding domain-containing protein [Laspinema olomoucense]|uniref:Peptidoglycan-binding protein n=1 Tax=Laspinema olomoucense D3b TaxID=2953688 RepID=A0ABT2NGR9_9CYAN|nr:MULTISPECIES: peptidoglycan-binding protein [unclassified Laspinema]MCT7980940.1 peptidoglycan-binding protein [Laspinema sp. D3b]MCT7995413.1 peptidoglycan-binding protein [Laspinema sp. D3c]
METFAYLQLFLVYDAPLAPLEPLAPGVRKFFAGFKGKNFSSAGLIGWFSVAITVALLSMATQVLAYQRGDESEAVRSIQVRLQQLGYFNTEPTRFYGEITEDAVRRFQRDNGLPVTGRVDPETLTAIERLLRPAASFGPVTQVGTTNQVLGLGNSGLQVSALQDQLRQLGYLNRAATGQFDLETEQAVLRFQQAFNLQRTGQVGPTTRGVLDQQLARIPAAPSWQPVTPIATGNATVNLKLGDRSIAVKSLQERLIAAGYAIGVADGTFGPRTEQALKEFQMSFGLVPSGVASAETNQALDRKFYIVVVPKRSNFTLSAVREIFPDAFEAENRLGTYIHAGSNLRREVAENRAKILKQRGLIDTRVGYF